MGGWSPPRLATHAPGSLRASRGASCPAAASPFGPSSSPSTDLLFTSSLLRLANGRNYFTMDGNALRGVLLHVSIPASRSGRSLLFLRLHSLPTRRPCQVVPIGQ